jgi:FlaA1/EpsC-like NDP-sugar epimerase
LADLAVLLAAFTLAYLLRYDFSIPQPSVREWLVQMPYVVMLQFGALLAFGAYSFIWQYVGMIEIKAFIKASALAVLPLLILRFGLPDNMQLFKVPLSITLMDSVFAYGGVLGVRVMRRAFYEHYQSRNGALEHQQADTKPVFLIGAGRAGVIAVKEILSRGDMHLKIKGFIDDDPKKQGATIHGVKVLGTTRDLPRLVAEKNIRQVVITIANASRKEFRRILDICEGIPVKVQVIPSLTEILQGRVHVSRIRDIKIEDLLGREPVCLEEESMKALLEGKTVMVTGAGGSIGSELARQVARFKLSALLLVERSEFALFNTDRELRQRYPDLQILPMIADVSDEKRMDLIFRSYHPQVLLHAAAHKHVPMMENNATEAVKNNVLATHLLAELAGEYGVEVFVLISTDKAVRPSSVMGASKRVAELVIQSLDRRYETRYVAVRFGNVIGSAGSVIPIFSEQIRQGGPVTVTHADMMRYFMTISEAAQLVIQACTMGRGGEIFILDMGEPVRILDLAKDLISLSGLRPYEDIDIVFTGIRPGEKLFEELETTGEEVSKTRHPKIFIGNIAAYPESALHQALGRLRLLCLNGAADELRLFLNRLLPEAGLTLPALELNPSAEPTEVSTAA